jgi:hypothetical protein
MVATSTVEECVRVLIPTAITPDLFMPMFERKLLIPGLGQFAAEGQSTVWESELNLPFMEENPGFLLRVRSKREGPTEAQIVFIQNMTRNYTAIKAEATMPMFNLFVEGGFAIDPKEKPENIWSHLIPGMIEIEKEESNGEIQAQIGFEMPLDPSAFPYIAIPDGQFSHVAVES